MKNLLNFALFQGVWFVAVWGASRGDVWLGAQAVLGMLVIHLALVTDRRRELAYLLAATLVGGLLDSVLANLGVLLYPTSEAWTTPTAPPWIISLWLAFAMLPRFSLGWLVGRPWLAFALGALGGPLSFLAGTRFDAIAQGSSWTLPILAVEYGVLTPILLHFVTRSEPEARAVVVKVQPGPAGPS